MTVRRVYRGEVGDGCWACGEFHDPAHCRIAEILSTLDELERIYGWRRVPWWRRATGWLHVHVAHPINGRLRRALWRRALGRSTREAPRPASRSASVTRPAQEGDSRRLRNGSPLD